VTIVPVAEPSERSQLAETILRALPQWFGIEQATRSYIRDVAQLQTFEAVAREWLTKQSWGESHGARNARSATAANTTAPGPSVARRMAPIRLDLASADRQG